MAGKTLSPRELAVMRVIADGVGEKGTALRVGVSPDRVKQITRIVRMKFDADSTTAACVKLAKAGLI